MKSILDKQISVKKLLMVLVVLPLILVAFMADSCDSQTTASNQNATTAGQKWGNSPKITNFYEYQQELAIYEARDNPNLVLNAYLFSPQTGNLMCFGQVKGFGIPYGTEMSPPENGTQGSVPEPNGLYPSQSTNADWVLLIDPKTGKTHLAFIEPDLIITDETLPCKPMAGA